VPAPYSGHLALVRTGDTSFLERQFTIPLAADDERLRSLGWRLVGARAFSLFEVPGAHASFLFRPDVSVVARVLRQWLPSILADRVARHDRI
jgi:hypothetical protein